MMRRPNFSVATLLWLVACAACLLAGTERQRKWDTHWFAKMGDAGPDENDFQVTIEPDALGRWTTTVGWGDGLMIRFEGGGLPDWAQPDMLGYTYPGRAATGAERRRLEEEGSLAPGTLNRRPIWIPK